LKQPAQVANITEAVLLVGGAGTRLKDTVQDRPKALAVVAGRAFLEWLLMMLRNQGIRRVILATGHMGELIESHVGDGSRFGLELACVRDPFPMGTGGSLRNALNRFQSQSLLVLNGDSFCRFIVHELSAFHSQHDSKATILLTYVNDASRFGIVETDSTDRVTAFREKSAARSVGWINAGVYLFDREVVDKIPQGRAVSLEREVFPGLMRNGLYAMKQGGVFWDIGTSESYAQAEQVLSEEFSRLQQIHGMSGSSTTARTR